MAGFDPLLGYVPTTFEEQLADLAALYEAETGIIVDLQQPSPTLDLLRVLARQAKAYFDDGGGTYGSGFVGTATGAALRNLLSPFIGPPLAAVATTVTLPLAGVAATLVPAGSQVTLDQDGVGALRWTLEANVVIPGDGVFAYAEAGPKLVTSPGDTWTIATPVAGWATAGPLTAQAQGRLAETELEYRQRFTDSTLNGQLVAQVRALDGVTNVSVFENPSGIPDAFWGETHWVEILVQGGDDVEIAQTIQRYRTFGVRTLGNVTQFVADPDAQAGTVEIRFSRPVTVDIWTELTITKGEGYPSDNSPAAVLAREQAIRDQITSWASMTLQPDSDVYAFQVAAQAAQAPSVPGIANIVATVGLVNPPVDASVEIGARDLAVFDDARILLIGV